jgi:hypothetical protein
MTKNTASGYLASLSVTTKKFFLTLPQDRAHYWNWETPPTARSHPTQAGQPAVKIHHNQVTFNP